ncbi:MAG: dihydrodipicolinate synthase family protein [Planctomycetota bacterium]|nr:dihydrodipicolinate synthase family protein [Planctomycetota bacterium]MEC8734377.1 dihydrodipicolinate synthase family protein [Planctomycetota bacterium]MEC9158758.1 dihydrodipicolinate synthase family protein [Planctomycetota bacterium]
MIKEDWIGVMPAITTPFDDQGAIDLGFMRRHARQMVEAGCTGLVTPGSLGEGGVLEPDEKRAIWQGLAEELDGRAPVIAAVGALSTAEAVRIAVAAEASGCQGLMILPPYAYSGRWEETEAHFDAVLQATPLSAMLYNNPVAYETDLRPDQIGVLADRYPNLHAVKESSGDLRRITAIREILGDRLAIFAGIDDLVVEAVSAGACGWIAGLVNALPVESVRLFELARNGPVEECRTLYEWFLPLLRMDAVPEFVHLVKLCQQEFGLGSERLRLPRIPLRGPAREAALLAIAEAKMNHAAP